MAFGVHTVCFVTALFGSYCALVLLYFGFEILLVTPENNKQKAIQISKPVPFSYSIDYSPLSSVLEMPRVLSTTS